MKGLLLGSVLDTLGKRLVRKRRFTGRVEAEQAKKRRIDDNDPPEEQGESSITFEGNKAAVFLQPGQLLVFDGCAMVCLIEGKASMLGYSLIPGVQVLVSSDAKLCSSLTFETWCFEAAGCRIAFESHYFGQRIDQPSFRLELRDASQEQRPRAAGRADKLDDDKRGRKRKLGDEKPARNMRATVLPSSWWVAIDSISRRRSLLPPIIPICGAKSSGKSTFSRFLANRLLESYKAVAYLDTDVGQPEFTIPGCLSLHILEQPVIGSPALHLREPERCYFYGDISAKSDPEMYLKYIVQLYDYFRQRFYDQGIPLIINTPGWTKGIGYDLLVDLLRYTVPSHLVELGDCELPPGVFWDGTGDSDAAIIRLSGVSYTEGARASDLRALRILSYFQQWFGKPLLPIRDLEEVYAEAAEALVSHIPYEVSVDDIKVVHLHIQVPASQTLYALNAQLVGLAMSSQQQGGIVPCIGLAVVRAVDAAKGIIYVLTPCPLQVLQEVDLILHGKIELPAGLLQTQGYVSPYLCSLSVVEGTGTSILRRRKSSYKRRLVSGRTSDLGR